MKWDSGRLAAAVALGTTLFGVPAMARAQELGIVFMASSNTVAGPISPAPPPPSGAPAQATTRSWREGGVFGMSIRVPKTRDFSLEVDALLAIKGVTLFGAGAASVRLMYLDVPILARVKVGSITSAPFFLFAGPSFGVKVNAKDLKTGTSLGSKVKRSDSSIVVGAGAIAHGLVLQLRVEWGIQNVANGAGILGSGSMKNRTVMFGLGIPVG